jgi:hypothetical protein
MFIPTWTIYQYSGNAIVCYTEEEARRFIPIYDCRSFIEYNEVWVELDTEENTKVYEED